MTSSGNARHSAENRTWPFHLSAGYGWGLRHSRRSVRGYRPPGLASRILFSDDVRQITGYAGSLRGSSLTDPGDATSTWHLRAIDKPERYDVAVRVWRLSGSALTHRYEKLLGSLPGSKQLPILGDRSFVIAQGEILGLGFLSQSASSLVLLTCGRGQCTTDDQLQKIAGKVAKHLNAISTHSPLGK